MTPVNIQALQTDARGHRLTQTWTVLQVAAGLDAIHRAAHRAGVARDLARRPMTTDIPVPIVVRSLALVEDRVHHRGPALAMVTPAITAQTNHVPSPVDAPVNPQALARVQIPAMMVLKTTCILQVKNLGVPALTTDGHVATAGERAVAGETTLMKETVSTQRLKGLTAEVGREGNRSGSRMSRWLELTGEGILMCLTDREQW
jgi:hypothetical protein